MGAWYTVRHGKEGAMPFYVVTYNGGTQESFEGVDDEDGLYIGLRRVPRLILAIGTDQARTARMQQNFDGVEIPVTITRDDGSVIFEGVRRHPMTRLPQFEGKISGDRLFMWNP